MLADRTIHTEFYRNGKLTSEIHHYVLTISFITHFQNPNHIPIALRIERDGKLLLQSIATAELQDSFADLILREIDLPHGVAQIETVYAGAKSFQQKELFKIALTCSIVDSITALGTCTKVVCILKSEITERPSVKNIFDTMMEGATLLKLPDKRPDQDGRSSVYNRLIDYLEQHKVGFRVFQKSDMEFFMTTIVTALWQLDGHWHKFSLASNVSKPPEALHFVPPIRNPIVFFTMEPTRRRFCHK